MEDAVHIPTMDATTLAVLRGAFQQIASEMDLTLRRSAFSPIITESADRGSGLYERGSGATIAQGVESLPIFVCTMQYALQRLLSVLEARGETGAIAEGDVYAFNDPYYGGTHVQDVKLIAPFFCQGKLFCWLMVTGHCSDMGGAVPGSFVPTAQECYAEGLRIPPVRLFAAGRLQAEVADMILENVRMPEAQWGDLEAMVSALRIGGQRMAALLGKYGAEVIDTAIAELRLRSEREMTSILSEMAEGSYEFEDFIDGDGLDDDPVRVHLRMSIKNGRAVLDFSQSAPPTRGPLNLGYSTTVAGAMVAIKHLFPEVQINAGCFAPYSFIIPETSFLHATKPMAVGGYIDSVARVVTVVLGAFAKVLPDRVPADWYGTALVLTISGQDWNGRRFVTTQANAGGMGAFKGNDGLMNAPALIGYARYPNVETLEQRAPVLVRSRGIRDGSGGDGKFRGAPGTTSEIEAFRKPIQVTVLGDRARFKPFGVQGGLAAEGTCIAFKRAGVVQGTPGRTKYEDITLDAGDSVRLDTPGGGGWGAASERAPSSVAHDLLEGYILPEQARLVYAMDESNPNKSFT